MKIFQQQIKENKIGGFRLVYILEIENIREI